MTRLRRYAQRLLAAAWLGSALSSVAVRAADAPPGPAAPARIEARSATLLAVALVAENRMSIHLSRMLDNAPVRDAVVTVLLRGVVHPTVSEADGSYSLQSPELRLPGSAAVEFQVVQGAARDVLKGTLQVTTNAEKPAEQNSARQLGWWVLNFAVCIGFLMLWSRRRKNAVEG